MDASAGADRDEGMKEQVTSTDRSWQPIKTAPLDTDVLLWFPPVSEGGPGCAGVGSRSIGGCWMDGYEELRDPTHWMPIPEPPK